MAKSRVKEIKTLSQSRFLSMYEAKYNNRVGDERSWMIASRKTPEDMQRIFFENEEDKIDAVIIFAEHVQEKKIVLVKQFRVPVNDFVYELPAGLVDPGENLEITVERELKEETGLELIEIDYQMSRLKAYVSVGMTDESVGFVRCSCRGTVSNEFLEADEELEACLLSKGEAKELLASGEKIDIKAVLAIQQFIMD